MEYPLIQKKWHSGINELSIVYPNKYYGGVYCLAPLIIYNLVNNVENWLCNRTFLDKGKLSSFTGFTLQYEPDYYNVVSMLKKAGIPLRKEERKEILFAGGPCANANPNTLSNYFDFFVMGEVEGLIEKVLAYYNGNKRKFLDEIASIKGIFVPDVTEKLAYNWLPSLDNVPYPLYQPFPEKAGRDFVFGKPFILEVERGCAFTCKFCPMPMFHGTVKRRSFESLKQIIDIGLKLNKRDKVVIYSPSFSHPLRNDILSYLLEKKVKFTVPSLKAELLDEDFLSLIKKGGQNSITLAPECGERLRKKIGKFGSDKVFIDAVESASNAGIKEVKLYLMAGLPGESLEDVKETVALVEDLKRSFKRKIYVSINPFVPKPGTEFGSEKFDRKKSAASVALLRKSFSKLKIRCKAGSVASAYREWKLAHAKSFP